MVAVVGANLEAPLDSLLIFVDDTGHERLSGDHILYGLGGLAIVTRDYVTLKDRWRSLRELVNGDPDAPLRAARLTRNGTDSQKAAVGEFFRANPFLRFAVTATRETKLPAEMVLMKPVIELTKKYVEDLSALAQFNSAALIVESSERADEDFMAQFGILQLGGSGRDILVEHCLMPKSAKEPGLEVADFVVNAAGRATKWKLSNRPDLPRDFQAVFHSIDGRHVRYMHMASVTGQAPFEIAAGHGTAGSGVPVG